MIIGNNIGTTSAPGSTSPCGTPPNALNDIQPPTVSANGLSATYTCQPGFVISTNTATTQIVIQCNTLLRSWSSTPQCVRKLYNLL